MTSSSPDRPSTRHGKSRQFEWLTRPDAVLTVCEVCLPDEAAPWLRYLRSAILCSLRTDAITIAPSGCTRLCPGEGRVTLVVSLPDGRTLTTGVAPTSESAHHLVAELGLLLGPDAWRGRRVRTDVPTDDTQPPRRAAKGGARRVKASDRATASPVSL